MKNILPADTRPRKLAFYLAMEEWAARNLPADEWFFAWRVSPTVICGRNQDVEAEVNLAYCRQHGIDVVRRRSGGGCVYADMDNWMFSYITPDTAVDGTFSHYTDMVASMLRSLGFAAEATGRNDIAIAGRKVAGNAFYHLPDRSIVHGTMLCDFDASRMASVLTPSRAKLESKSVCSVPSRITCLRNEGLAMSVEDFGRYAVDFLCRQEPLTLTREQMAEIEKIEETYNDAWLRGRKRPASNITRSRRFDEAGEFTASIKLDSESKIAAVDLSGDYFATGDVDALLAALKGIPYSTADISGILRTLEPDKVIAGLKRERLLEILI